MWGAIIAAGASIAGGIMGQMSAQKQKWAIRKAATKNYNTMMNNSRMMEKSVYDNMTSYERDAAEYRSTMFQRTMANGGIRADESTKEALAEIKGYEFGIDAVDTEKYSDQKQEVHRVNPWTGGEGSEKQRQYWQTKSDAKIDDKNNEALYNALMNYQGKTAEFSAGGDNTALLMNRQSIKELQEDLNKTYVQGMTEVLQQRQQAQNAWQSQETQAQMYQIQGMQSLWNGLLGAGSTMVNAWEQQSAANRQSASQNAFQNGLLARLDKIAANTKR